MQILITPLVLAVAVFQTLSTNTRRLPSDPVLVRSVVNGESIEVAGVGRVRLTGIEAPSAALSKTAREHLASLVLNRWVRLEGVGKTAYVMREDGVFVNAEMVRAGLARVSRNDAAGRANELRRAEREAQAFRRGMWRQSAAGYTRGSAPAGDVLFSIRTSATARSASGVGVGPHATK